jgi:hypothetical protein
MDAPPYPWAGEPRKRCRLRPGLTRSWAGDLEKDGPKCRQVADMWPGGPPPAQIVRRRRHGTERKLRRREWGAEAGGRARHMRKAWTPTRSWGRSFRESPNHRHQGSLPVGRPRKRVHRCASLFAGRRRHVPEICAHTDEAAGTSGPLRSHSRGSERCATLGAPRFREGHDLRFIVNADHDVVGVRDGTAPPAAMEPAPCQGGFRARMALISSSTASGTPSGHVLTFHHIYMMKRIGIAPVVHEVSSALSTIHVTSGFCRNLSPIEASGMGLRDAWGHHAPGQSWRDFRRMPLGEYPPWVALTRSSM